jgi:hypothetical protein
METSIAQSVKLTIVEVSHLSKDALHIYLGLGVFVVTALVFRKRIQSSLVPWLAVLLVASLGEIVDMHDDIKTLGYWRWAASLHDVLNTMFWPTVLLILARFTRLFGSSVGPKSA